MARRCQGRATVVASLAVVFAGCATVSTTVMLNPVAHGGRVPVNLVPVFDSDRAERFGVSETMFAQEATLLSVDAHHVCFVVTIRTEASTPTLASLGGWRVSLHGSQGLANDHPLIGPPTPPTAQSILGAVIRREYLGTTTCSRMNGCTPQYAIYRDPTMLTLLTASGSVCFDHGGRFGASTDRVELQLQDPADSLRRFVFRWRLLP